MKCDMSDTCQAVLGSSGCSHLWVVTNDTLTCSGEYSLEGCSQSPLSGCATALSLPLSEAACPLSSATSWEPHRSPASPGGVAPSASMSQPPRLNAASAQDLMLYGFLTPASDVTFYCPCVSKHVFNSLLGLNLLKYEKWEHHFT